MAGGKRSASGEPRLVERRSDRVVKRFGRIGFLAGVRHVHARVHRCRGLRYTSAVSSRQSPALMKIPVKHIHGWWGTRVECGPIRRGSPGHAFFPRRPRGRELVYYVEAGDTVLPLMVIPFPESPLLPVPVYIAPRYLPRALFSPRFPTCYC